MKAKYLILGVLAYLQLCAQAPLMAQEMAAIQSPVANRESASGAFSPRAQATARLLGVYPQVERLIELRSKPELDGSERQEILVLKLDLTESILTTLLEIESVNAQIKTEETQAREIRSYLEERRDRAINYNTAANFVSGGVSEILGGAFELEPKLVRTSSIIDVVGGGLQTAFSALAMRQQVGRNYKERNNPNMLAALFDLRSDEDSNYSEIIWKYLNSVPSHSADGRTRRQLLIANWSSMGKLDRGSKDAYLRHVKLLSDATDRNHMVNIALLKHRATMLSDLSALVSQISRDLLDLMRCIKQK